LTLSRPIAGVKLASNSTTAAAKYGHFRGV
jgi:hypothetical protein